MSDFGELRSLLHGEPSRGAFDAVIGMFRAAADADEAERVWLPYALERVKAWRPGVRALAPDREDLSGEEPPAWMTLVCELNLGSWEVPGGWLRALFGSRSCANLRAFSYTPASAPEGLLGWIARSEHLTRLESLRVYNARGAGADLGLGEAARARLVSLDLYGCAIGDEGAAELARALALAPLRTLRLRSCGVGDAGVRALAPALDGVEHLNLSANVFGEDGARALARRPGAPWRVLDLSGVVIGDAGAEALAASGRLAGCEMLTLSGCGIGDDGIAALARSSGLRALESLDLRDDAVGDAGAFALASADLPALTSLDVSGNQIGARGVIALLRAPHLGALEFLELNGNACGEDDLGELPEDRPRAGRLEMLDLASSGVGSGLISAVAQTRALSSVTSLSAYANAVDAVGARALGRSPYVGALGTLDLEGSPVSDEGFAALLAEGGERLGALEVLDVAETGLTDASAGVLPGSGLTRLRELVASSNGIGEVWLQALAESPVSRTLRVLSLSETNTGDDGARVLAAAPNLSGLTSLVLGRSGVTDLGLRALLLGGELAGLMCLDSKVAASDETLAAFAVASGPTPIERLRVGPVDLSGDTWSALALSERLRGLLELTTLCSPEPARAVVTRLARAGEVLNPWAEAYMIE